MKDYYAILRIQRYANSNEIKRAYRKLAIQYHPDKNPDVSAEHVFKEINEAYEVLGDPSKKASYDLRLTNPYVETVAQSSPRPHRDPAYRRRRAPVYRKSERERLIEIMATMLPLANKIVYFSFAICVLFALDYGLPFRHTNELIFESDFQSSSRKNVTQWWVVTTNSGRRIQLFFRHSDDFKTGDTVVIESTQLLNVPLKITGKTAKATISKSIYRSFSFVPIALFLTSWFGIYYRKKIDYGFNSGLICSLILTITLIVYLMMD
jgi:hypothetical protein